MATAQAALDDAPSAARETGVALVGLVVGVLVGYGLWAGFYLDNLHNGLLALTFTAVGLYVVRMRPGHRVGRLFAAVGVLQAGLFFGRQYARHEPRLPAADWLAWVAVWPVPLVIAIAGVAVMAFPNGRMLSRRWRRAAIVMVVLGILLSVASALWPIEDDWDRLVVEHPLQVVGASWAERTLWPVTVFLYLAFQVLWAAAVIARMRQAGAEEVRQLRWFVYAVAIALSLLLVGAVVWQTPLPGLITLSLIPVAAGIAIFKYRLYDIDPVINKSLVVGAMVLMITVGYVVVVVGVGALLPRSDPLLSLVATAVVALLFEPVRRRAQRLADRLVYGHRATPYEALAQLSAQLPQAPEGLLGGIAATVAKAVGATDVVVWLGDEREMVPAATWPDRAGENTATQAVALADLGIGPRTHLRPVVHRGRVLGAITVTKQAGESLSRAERQLLDDLVAQTGLVIDHQAQAAGLEAAARRIVTATDAARRKIERDLHDGVQQRLVTLGLELGGLAEGAAVAGNSDLAARAESARRQLLEATAELREMARGLHPSVLTQDGLEPALANLADRSPIPVRLRVSVAGRQSAEVEATVYFLISEGVTNAARHSGASLVEVVAKRDRDGLRVEVADDGVGGADPVAGSGLQGMVDRLAALGARLEMESPLGGGTRLRTVIPVGSPRPCSEGEAPCG